MNSAIKRFHINYGYFVRVKTIPNLIGCVAEFPSNILDKNKVKKSTRTYIINYDYKTLEHYHLIDGRKIISREIKVQPYCVRVLVISDILLRTAHLNISPELIIAMDGNNKEIDTKITNIMKIELNKDYADREKVLFGLIKDINDGDIDHDIGNDILEGYQQLVQCFVTGGL